MDFVCDSLAFNDMKSCEEWLLPLGLTFVAADKKVIDCKNSVNASF